MTEDSIFFCFAIVYYSRKHHRHVEEAFKLQIERDELMAVTAVLNDPSYREAASAIADSFEAAGGAQAAADRLEKLI